MVVRNQDSPAVQSFLKETGRSDSYGVSSGSSGGSNNGGILEALSAIYDLLANMPAPKVYLDSALISEGLKDYGALSA
jgi:hypothetical protein